MKIGKRLFFASILLTFIFLLMICLLFYLAFPISDWKLLWQVKVLEVPFIFMVPTMALLFGLMIGLICSHVVRKRIIFLEQSLTMLMKNQTFMENPGFDEIDVINQKLKEVRDYIQQQTKRTQKLIDERTQDQENKLNKVISEERNRLARELHDSVSQELFAASMLVSAVNASNIDGNEMMTKQLGQIESMIQQAQLEMRALLLHLRPVPLKDNTLKEGMENLLQELKAKVSVHITWNVEDVIVNKGIEDHLFRILQEALSNALRHARAETIDTILIERDGFVILRVKDDGRGFELNEKKAGSYGISNMYERAAEIGAHIHLVSIPKEGTRLEVRVPMIEEEEDDKSSFRR
ncbi:two-component system, NarL family, sensor histidine kinase LiaS [Gracilibacillus ureilyticus]|uniref:Sensor histidine kinase n=1 Tax=Gracilibacillus ureilyticus TaxID=531814 RepID=A0A1H9SXJ2_9BACI|nr:sensor histidine kinase [Gracilibacillus ureilyticus]SER89557.1 two-component system, NarL family, sensor histidine kinase LiaS [Gracilibacillus ureilyticus]